MQRLLIAVLIVLALLLAACTPATQAPTPAGQAMLTPENPPAASEAPALPSPTTGGAAPATETSAPMPVTPSDTPAPAPELATYTDEADGFSLDYPAGWQVDPLSLGDRARMVQLTSWQHVEGSIAEVPDGESILQVQVLQWDPKGNLPAYLAQRRSAWEASGIQILNELQRTLPGIGEAVEYTVQGTDGAQGYFLIAALGDQYLTASGSGDLTQLAEIARTLRVE